MPNACHCTDIANRNSVLIEAKNQEDQMKREIHRRWIFGVPLGVGMLLTASDGYWFPVTNLAGIAFILLGSLLSKTFQE